jgi:hypothetical protein
MNARPVGKFFLRDVLGAPKGADTLSKQLPGIFRHPLMGTRMGIDAERSTAYE